jgi:hypothetical protein
LYGWQPDTQKYFLTCTDIVRTLAGMSTSKKIQGRDRRGGGSKADRIEFRLDPNEREAFQDAADLAGIPLSHWIRERLRRVAASELEAAGLKAAFLRNFKLD